MKMVESSDVLEVHPVSVSTIVIISLRVGFKPQVFGDVPLTYRYVVLYVSVLG